MREESHRAEFRANTVEPLSIPCSTRTAPPCQEQENFHRYWREGLASAACIAPILFGCPNPGRVRQAWRATNSLAQTMTAPFVPLLVLADSKVAN